MMSLGGRIRREIDQYIGPHFEDQKKPQKWGATWRYRAVCHGLIIKWTSLMLGPIGPRSVACSLRCKRAGNAMRISEHIGFASAIALRGGGPLALSRCSIPNGSMPLPVPCATKLRNSVSILEALPSRLGGPLWPNIGAHCGADFGGRFGHQAAASRLTFWANFGYQK